MTDRAGALDELDVETCFRLLRTLEVGRVAVATVGGAPHVVPVSYVVRDETIVFRSDEGTKLVALLDGPASFQVDLVDSFHRGGWSVLVQGVAEEIEPDVDLALRPWAGNELAHWIRIVPITVTGRLLTMPTGETSDGRGYV